MFRVGWGLVTPGVDGTAAFVFRKRRRRDSYNPCFIFYAQFGQSSKND